jgi:hypothetical protein
MRTVTVALLIAFSVALTGCYEDSSITLHDPGVYRGAKDPLLAKQASPEQQAKLAERLKLSQGDR